VSWVEDAWVSTQSATFSNSAFLSGPAWGIGVAAKVCEHEHGQTSPELNKTVLRTPDRSRHPGVQQAHGHKGNPLPSTTKRAVQQSGYRLPPKTTETQEGAVYFFLQMIFLSYHKTTGPIDSSVSLLGLTSTL
jgi:hypothetical protein